MERIESGVEADLPQRKQRVGLQLPPELIERARAAVYWTPGLTLNELAERALSDALYLIESLRGSPFPPRKGPLRVGRRIRLKT
jgi:hypothetical protein